MRNIQKLILSMAIIILMPLSFANNNIQTSEDGTIWTATMTTYNNTETFDVSFFRSENKYIFIGNGEKQGIIMRGNYNNNDKTLKITQAWVMTPGSDYYGQIAILLTGKDVIDGRVVGNNARLSFYKQDRTVENLYTLTLKKKSS